GDSRLRGVALDDDHFVRGEGKGGEGAAGKGRARGGPGPAEGAGDHPPGGSGCSPVAARRLVAANPADGEGESSQRGAGTQPLGVSRGRRVFAQAVARTPCSPAISEHSRSLAAAGYLGAARRRFAIGLSQWPGGGPASLAGGECSRRDPARAGARGAL